MHKNYCLNCIFIQPIQLFKMTSCKYSQNNVIKQYDKLAKKARNCNLKVA